MSDERKKTPPKTLLDDFAMAAVTGILAHGLDVRRSGDTAPHTAMPADIAELAYRVAEAMAIEREKGSHEAAHGQLRWINGSEYRPL